MEDSSKLKTLTCKRLDRKVVYESNWVNLYTDKVLMPSGKVIEKYHILDYQNDTVVILLKNLKNEICFIRAIRYTTQKNQWELPAGGINKGEDVLKAAKRECLEETGFESENLKLHYTFNPANGMSTQTVNIVSGQIKDLNQAVHDKDEVKSVHWLTIGKIKKLIENNEITDGISLMALLLLIKC